jgi:hypothetical protein
VKGLFDTSFISRYIGEESTDGEVDNETATAGAILAANLFVENKAKKEPVIQTKGEQSNWKNRAWH